MLKKCLFIVSIFCLIIFASSTVFAANITQGAGNVLNGARNGVEHLVNGTTNAARSAKDGVSNIMDDLGNDAERGKDHFEDDMTRDDNKDMTNGDNQGYTATRTAADAGNAVGGASNAFLWVILAIVAVVIVALVWYYGTQTENRSNH